jgi:hypothetical protein
MWDYEWVEFIFKAMACLSALVQPGPLMPLAKLDQCLKNLMM